MKKFLKYYWDRSSWTIALSAIMMVAVVERRMAGYIEMDSVWWAVAFLVFVNLMRLFGVLMAWRDRL
jgi:hypothetical protein